MSIGVTDPERLFGNGIERNQETSGCDRTDGKSKAGDRHERADRFQDGTDFQRDQTTTIKRKRFPKTFMRG